MRELEVGSVFAGHRIEGMAGAGGMGVVYRATHLALDAPRALKLIAPASAGDEQFRERFRREARIAASIEHPNVIPLYHAGEEDGLLYVTMRYVDGPDLGQLVARSGRLEPSHATHVVEQVGAALDAAHSRGLVHRDVKPANILLEGEAGRERVYLTDFGLTKLTASDSRMTAPGMAVGTYDYMAPEQWRGDEVEARTDVYALGCVLWETLCGRPPFGTSESLESKLYSHLETAPPPAREHVPSLSPQFDDVISRAMAKRRDERYPSAGDLGRAARAASQGSSERPNEESVATGPAAAGDRTVTGAVLPIAAAAGHAGSPGPEAAGAAPGGPQSPYPGGGDQPLPPPPPPPPAAGPPPGGAGYGGPPPPSPPPTFQEQAHGQPSPPPGSPGKPRSKAPWIALAVIVGLLAIAGIAFAVLSGGGGTDEYADDIDPLLSGAQGDVDDLGQITSTSSFDDDAQRFGAVEDSMGALSADLQEIEPPSEAATEHDAVVDAALALEDASAEGVQAAEDSTTEGYPDGYPDELDAAAEFTEASNDLRAAVGLPTSSSTDSSTDDSQEYANEVDSLLSGVQGDVDDLDGITSTSAFSDDARRFEAVEGSAGSFATDLNALEPPSEAATEHTALVDAARTLESDALQGRESAEDETVDNYPQGYPGELRAARRFNAAADDLQAALP